MACHAHVNSVILIIIILLLWDLSGSTQSYVSHFFFCRTRIFVEFLLSRGIASTFSNSHREIQTVQNLIRPTHLSITTRANLPIASVCPYQHSFRAIEISSSVSSTKLHSSSVVEHWVIPEMNIHKIWHKQIYFLKTWRCGLGLGYIHPFYGIRNSSTGRIPNSI